jgi:5-methyltetrahydrofolate--homocysteine methyltransferase
MEIVQISAAILELNKESAKSLVVQALEENLDPVEILQEGIIQGLSGIGEKFEAGEYFLTELMIGGKISEECINLIRPHLPDAKGAVLGTVVIGAVEGDIHDLGYSLVATQLELNGFAVHKLGVNVPSMEFIDKAKEVNADIIGLSAFLVTTIPKCREVINYLRDMGLRNSYKVIIGGAETSQSLADEIGADGWGMNAFEAVELCRKLIKD